MAPDLFQTDYTPEAFLFLGFKSQLKTHLCTDRLCIFNFVALVVTLFSSFSDDPLSLWSSFTGDTFPLVVSSGSQFGNQTDKWAGIYAALSLSKWPLEEVQEHFSTVEESGLDYLLIRGGLDLLPEAPLFRRLVHRYRTKKRQLAYWWEVLNALWEEPLHSLDKQWHLSAFAFIFTVAD